MEYFHYLFNPEILFNESFNDIKCGMQRAGESRDYDYCVTMKLGALSLCVYVCRWAFI